MTVTVEPTADVVATASQTICDGESTNIALSSNATGTQSVTYTWAAVETVSPQGGILTFEANCNSGCGTAIQEQITNTGITPGEIVYTVTPTIGACMGIASTVTVTINPTAQVNDPADLVLCHDASVSSITFTTDRSGGTTTYTWSTNNDAIWSLGASGNGHIPFFTVNNTSTSPIVAIVTVTPTFTYNGISCDGDAETFTITVNPLGQVNDPADMVVCVDSPVTVNFTTNNNGVGVTSYTWTNTNTNIGLGASGDGHISFTSANTSTVPITGIIEVTPTYTNEGVSCVGETETMTITVNPPAQVNAIGDQQLCNGFGTTTVTFATINSGGTTTYTWTNDNTDIGLAASGSGPEIPQFTATNSTSAPIVGLITVTPYFEGCIGETTTFTYTVDPTPTVTSDAAKLICDEGNVDYTCLLYTSPSPRDRTRSRMPSSA